MPDPSTEKALERLRAAAMAPRLAAPVDTEPPAPLKSTPPPPRRQVGRKIVEGERGVRS